MELLNWILMFWTQLQKSKKRLTGWHGLQVLLTGRFSYNYTVPSPITSLTTPFVMAHPSLPWFNIWLCGILCYTYLSAYCLCKPHRTGTLSYSLLRACSLSTRRTRRTSLEGCSSCPQNVLGSMACSPKATWRSQTSYLTSLWLVSKKWR